MKIRSASILPRAKGIANCRFFETYHCEDFFHLMLLNKKVISFKELKKDHLELVDG